mmetsp:Transcript_3736/g.4326  ORF Transcript_3736/g.4326 Transcript_3736/m.4326 type:complete len:335 (-) Transcript_3736:349-1353(-)|eukprot:CAMPEP_0204822196 /NCGR_PEP_ID=MMETSP1346-20131115/385_1 /ASSEMBLY_ACC=CAM_ASM_000771 /TAXON_ID=215587 /ORGANISM="Aplanochytrium stocchinoi, Strain GSBS06" /LENGTH=334 /DNA_ID=CAMNT_0051948277 /DNA_START=161 /DNA_END=1165 /DNA_ORIENTATION=+
MSKIPPALKAVKPFFLRAQEVEKSNKNNGEIVAFLCRQYAVGKALNIPGAKEAPGVMDFLMGMMDKLEAAKSSKPILKDQEACQSEMQDFALKVFQSADDQYKAGLADKGTARSFYAAASFLEVARPDDPEFQNLRKYAKFKATDIIKAIKDGRDPLPPELLAPAADDNDAEKEEENTDVSMPEAPTNDPVPATENESAATKHFGLARAMSYKEETKPKPARRISQLKPKGTGGTKETKEAEGLTKEAIRFLQTGKEQKGAEKLCSALRALANGTHTPRLPNGGISDAKRDDAIEYAYFAARTLECIGLTVSIDEGIDRAIDLLSHSLQQIESD